MKTFLILFLALTFQSVAFGQKSEVFIAGGKAIAGYDPVAYFTEKKPVKGKPEFNLEYLGAVWYFSSEANKKLFQASPDTYAPQYGGYCAFGAAGGYKAKISPDAWSIVNNKLYLNYDQNVQMDWLNDKEALIKKADSNWPVIKKN